MNETDLIALINFHARGHRVPESLEVRRHAWRLLAQARFNAVGLPRGLRDVG